MGRRGRNNLFEESIFFITTTVVKFANVFEKDKYCDLLIHNIKHYQKRYNFKILAYVIMPSHFHWIVITDRKKGTISDIMRDIKKYSAWDIMDHLEKDNNYKLLNVFENEGRFHKNHKRKLWMKRFDDEVIRNEKMFWVKLNYIHNNPVEAGLAAKPGEYKYSSAINYLFGDHSVITVDTKFAGIDIK